MSASIIRRELADVLEEQELLAGWDVASLAEIIRDVGFSCTLCGQCCTVPFNGHVFLLDEDAERAISRDPDSVIPAPDFEFCDEEGSFYVSGYALRVDQDGSCIYLHDGRCQIYDERYSICRIYPYMLHREPDRKKRLQFRQISGLNEHGEYHVPISEDEAVRIAHQTIAYERAWLSQMIGFYSAVLEIFEASGKRHIRRVYDQRMAEFRAGAPLTVYVWYMGNFITHQVRCEDYRGFAWP